MNKIRKLIEKLCLDGVEYKYLKDISQMKRGSVITEKSTVQGRIPVISGGKEPAYYCNQYNREGETITVAGSGVGAGFVSYWNEPIFVADAFSIKACVNYSTKYLYYYLANNQEKIYATQKGGGVPHVHISSIENFMIPLPPVEVQHEIVRILDSFAELTVELEAELVARKQQYEYYLNKLLTEVQNERTFELDEIFIIKNGYTPSKKKKSFWDNGTLPWFRMEDIRVNGRILDDSIQHITPEAVKGELFAANSIMLATTATIGEHALLTVDALTNQRFTVFSKNTNRLNELGVELDIKYVFYYFFIIDEWCKRNVLVGNFSSVDIKKLKKYRIPIPSIQDQHRIVNMLECFDKLCNSITSGLPGEIDARKKQYEYYRDKLLTFKEKEA